MKYYNSFKIIFIVIFCSFILIVSCSSKSENVAATSDLRQIYIWINIYKESNITAPSNLKDWIGTNFQDQTSKNILHAIDSGKIKYQPLANIHQPMIVWQTSNAIITLYGSGHIESSLVKSK